MDLDFSEEQEVLRGMVRDLCDEHSPVDVVRAMEDDPKGYPDELWKQLGEVGLLGIRIPERHGGSEQGLLETVIAYEEFGRALAPTPHLVSCIVSAGVIERAGSEAQQREWLPAIASGEAILTPAWIEPDHGFGPEGVTVQARREGDAFVLDGTKRHVYFAAAATRLLVVARSGEGAADIDLFLVDPNAPGVRLTQQLSLAADAQYRVDFDGVRVPAADRIGGAGAAAGSGWSALDDVLYDAAILNAAWAAGGADRALEITVEYAKERKQFDKPLGAFQAIAHYLADARTKIDGGRTLVHQAAWARDNGKDVRQLAPMAKLFMGQTYRDVTAMCEQVWGGVGFTIEYDIQLYFRRAKQLQLSWWDTSHLEELVAHEALD